MTAVCPSCGCEQGAALLCAQETDQLEKQLHAIPDLLDELATTVSKQAKIGQAGGKPGPAHLRNPINYGALDVATHLSTVLNAWAHAVWHDKPIPDTARLAPLTAARVLLANIDHARRHPDVDKLVTEVGEAVGKARQAIDRPATRVYVGLCRAQSTDQYGQTVQCSAELYARENATQVHCRVCNADTDVVDQRKWLLEQAEEMIVTAKQASVLVGDVGQLTVRESDIRNWVARGKIPLRPSFSTQRQFELGALLTYISQHSQPVPTLSLARITKAV